MVVVGGSSLIQGLVRRLDQEISAAFPSLRVRVTAPSNTVERKYATWIGGSILASLGSFHQVSSSSAIIDDEASNALYRCGSRRKSMTNTGLASSRTVRSDLNVPLRRPFIRSIAIAWRSGSAKAKVYPSTTLGVDKANRRRRRSRCNSTPRALLAVACLMMGAMTVL